MVRDKLAVVVSRFTSKISLRFEKISKLFVLISLHFLILLSQVEGDSEKCLDYIQVFDGPSVDDFILEFEGRKQICGYNVPNPSTVTSASNMITITFHSDHSTTLAGFMISYVANPIRKRRNVKAVSPLVDEKVMNAPISSDNENQNKQANPSLEKNLTSKASSRNFATNQSHSDSRMKRGASSDSNDPVGDADPSDYEAKDASFSDAFQGINSYYSLWRATSLPDFSDFRRVVNFKRDVVASIGHQIDDFIVQCTYDGLKCDGNMFKPYQDHHYGNCFSFNSIRSRNVSDPISLRQSSKTGQEFGLKLTFFVDAEDYVGKGVPLKMNMDFIF